MEYLDHIIPVAANAEACGILRASAGLRKSPIPAITNPYSKKIQNICSL